jgi:hypothetical protein
VLTAGVAAGFLSWIVGEWTLKAFKPKLFRVQVMLETFIQPTTQSQNAADLKNAALAFTIFGGFTALAMGLAGGVAGLSRPRGLVVGLIAGLTGAVIGGFASLALLPRFYHRLVPDPNDLLPAMTVHGGIWTAISAVSGLALAVAMGRARRIPSAIIGACLGAVLATVLFHLLSAAVFPDSGSTEPVARSSFVRLLARFLVAAFISAGAVRGVLGRGATAGHPLSNP